MRLDHERLLLAAGVLEQVALLATRQIRLAVGQQSGPEDVAAEHPALLVGEIPIGDRRVGKDLPAALLVQLRADRRDDPVLPEQPTHRLDVYAIGLELDQIEDAVVPVGDVHDVVLVPDFAAFQPQLGRIGVHGLESVPRAEELDQRALLVDPLALVLGLDEADAAASPVGGGELVRQLPQEQVARVGRAG